jgi:hypothetical protein
MGFVKDKNPFKRSFRGIPNQIHTVLMHTRTLINKGRFIATGLNVLFTMVPLG